MACVCVCVCYLTWATTFRQPKCQNVCLWAGSAVHSSYFFIQDHLLRDTKLACSRHAPLYSETCNERPVDKRLTCGGRLPHGRDSTWYSQDFTLIDIDTAAGSDRNCSHRQEIFIIYRKRPNKRPCPCPGELILHREIPFRAPSLPHHPVNNSLPC